MSYTSLTTTKTKSAKNEQSLTKRQQAFIDALVTTGGNLKAAALILGYPEHKAEYTGRGIWRSERVQAAYKAALWDKLGRSAGVAVNTLADLAASGNAKVRREAADSILDRLGFKEAGQTAHAGITINIGLKGASDTGATQPPVIDGEAIDVHTIVDERQGDDPSD